MLKNKKIKAIVFAFLWLQTFIWKKYINYWKLYGKHKGVNKLCCELITTLTLINGAFNACYSDKHFCEKHLNGVIIHMIGITMWSIYSNFNVLHLDHKK